MQAINRYKKVGFILIKVVSSEIIVMELITSKIAKFIRLNFEIFLFFIYSIAVKLKVVITKPIVAINILKDLYKIKKIPTGSISKIFDTFCFY